MGYNDPTRGASNMVGQIPGATDPYYRPYMDAGRGAMTDLQNQYKDLLGGGVYDRLGQGYKESPGYKFKLQQAMQGAGNAAAAGGMAGSPMHQQDSMQLAHDISDQDFNNYMQNQMGLYGLGLQGEQGMNQMGYDASNQQANNVGNSMNQQGQYNFMGQQGRNQYRQARTNNWMSGLGMAAGLGASMFPGGGFLSKFFGG